MEYWDWRTIHELEQGDPEELGTTNDSYDIPDGMSMGQRDLLRLNRRLNQLSRACTVFEGYPLTMNERAMLTNIETDTYRFHEFMDDNPKYEDVAHVSPNSAYPMELEYAGWTIRILESVFDDLVWMVRRRLGIGEDFYERRTYRNIPSYENATGRRKKKKHKKKRRASPSQFVWLGSSGHGVLVDPNTGAVIREGEWN